MSDPKSRRAAELSTRKAGGPFDPLSSRQRPLFSPVGRPWLPPTDVGESEDRILIRMEVPGLAANELSIMQEEHFLVVSGVRRRPADEETGSYQLMEIQYGPFERVFELPAYLNLEEITAVYDAGFLTIQVPKTDEPPLEAITIKIRVQEKS